jgi:hypothetical protein
MTRGLLDTDPKRDKARAISSHSGTPRNFLTQIGNTTLLGRLLLPQIPDTGWPMMFSLFLRQKDRLEEPVPGFLELDRIRSEFHFSLTM